MFKSFIRLSAFSIASFIIFSGSFARAAVAASGGARLADCTMTGGTGLDGSDCDAGLICDSAVKICVNTFEVGCKGPIGCSVGTICKDAGGKRVTGSTAGVCEPDVGSSTDKNAISDILCNLYKFITGKTGRIVIGIIFVGAGGTFLLGKMQLGTVIAIALGCGCIFGASAIVGVFVGKGFAC